MREHLLNLKSQVIEALSLGNLFASHTQVPRGVTKILFCGLGGSAISGEILRRLAFRNEKYPFLVFRAAGLPKWVDKNTLVILSSYSGNTKEVLANFKQAYRAKAKLLIVTSGGKLAKAAEKNRLSYVKIPGGIPPRCAVGYLTFSLIATLRKGGFIRVSDSEIREVISILRRPPLAKARNLAKKLAGKTVRVYAVAGILDPALVRWKAQIAENAKMIISSCVLPEMFHNEVEGWVHPRKIVKNSVALFFIDRDDPLGVKKQRRVAMRAIRKNGAQVLEVRPEGEQSLSRIFSLCYLGDWVSFELARLYGADPLEIPTITALKKVH